MEINESDLFKNVYLENSPKLDYEKVYIKVTGTGSYGYAHFPKSVTKFENEKITTTIKTEKGNIGRIYLNAVDENGEHAKKL